MKVPLFKVVPEVGVEPTRLLGGGFSYRYGFRRPRGRVREVLVRDVEPELLDAFEDLVVALLEEGEGLGVEIHGVSWYFVRMAAVAAAIPSLAAASTRTRRISS